MSTINRSALYTKLQQYAETNSYSMNSNAAADVLNLILSMKAFNDTNIIVVATADHLPNLKYNVSPGGMVYFINDIDIFAISSNGKWLTLDGRVIRQDTYWGETFSWGQNTCGLIGDNTTINRSSPASIAGCFTDWCQVSAGNTHALGLRTNGTIWSWGCGCAGHLGDNTTIDKSSPVSVVGGFTNWCQIAAGNSQNLAIRTDGTLWAWGWGFSGRLGDNTTINKSSPISVVGGFTDWSKVAAGGTHSLGIRAGGTAWAWGIACCGGLGDNTTIDKSSPVSVVGGFTDWCQISGGGCHSVAVRTNGTAWAWGRNDSAQLGDNSTIAKSSPVSVVGGFTDWCQVSAGYNISVGVRTNGTMWSWGCGTFGTLGDGTSGSNRSSPVSVIGGFTDWCQVSLKGCHSIAVRTNGTAWAWGIGIIGDGLAAGPVRASPVSVISGFTDWYQLSASVNGNSLGLRRRT